MEEIKLKLDKYLPLKRAIVGSAHYWAALGLLIAQLTTSSQIAIGTLITVAIINFILHWWIGHEEREAI